MALSSPVTDKETLFFKDINNFLDSFISNDFNDSFYNNTKISNNNHNNSIDNNDSNEKYITNSFTKINDFLNANINFMKDIKIFNITNNDDDFKEVDSIKIDNTVYKINKYQCQQSYFISKKFSINYKDCVRIIASSFTKLEENKNINDTTGVCTRNERIDFATIDTFYLETILNERMAIIDVLYKLININHLPILNDKFSNLIFQDDMKFIIINQLIETIKLIKDNFKKLNNIPSHISPNSQVYENIPHYSNNKNMDSVTLKNLDDIIYVTKLLKILSLLTLNCKLSNDIVLNWFYEIKSLTNFVKFDILLIAPDFPYSILSQLLALININSFIILGFKSSIQSLDIDSPFFNDSDTFIKLQEIIDNDLMNNALLTYYWSCILFTKSILLDDIDELPENATDSNQQKFIQQYNKKFDNISMSNFATLFAQRAEKLDVFQIIVDISDAFSNEILYPTILSSFVLFLLNFVPLSVEVSNVIKKVLHNTPVEFIENFLSSDTFHEKFVILKAKLPLIDEALLPFINISSVLAEFANFEWKKLNTYATKTKLGELDYDIVDELDSNQTTESQSLTPIKNEITTTSSFVNDLIILKKETLITPPLEIDPNILMPVPINTKAKLLQSSSSSDDHLIVFSLDYNGWSVLGRIIQNISLLYLNQGVNLDSRTKELMLSSIELVQTVVDSNDSSIGRSTEILESLSSHIEDNEDVISVIFKIFEIALNKRDYKVLCCGSKFMNALTVNFPHFVWSYLTRSTLLDRYGKTGLINIILGTLELPNGEYDFTINLSKLTNLLVDDSLSSNSSIPDTTKKEILQKLTVHFIHIFEGCQSWKFNEISQKFELCDNLICLFSSILTYVYGIDEFSSPNEKVTKILSSTGQAVVTAFLGNKTPDSYASNALIHTLTSHTSNNISFFGNDTFNVFYNHLVSACYKLTTMLINIRDTLSLPPSMLEKGIFKDAAIFVELYIGVSQLKRPIVKLFTSLVSVSWNDEYPFLLSYLGENSSKDFLNIISSDLQVQLNDTNLLKDIYLFLGALLKSKQDGLAILFLTGNVASNSNSELSKDKQVIVKSSESDSSILTILKANALNMNETPEYVTCALLDAIAFAFNSWAHPRSLQKDTQFIDALLKKFKNFKPLDVVSLTDIEDSSKTVEVTLYYRSISRILEIFALYLYISPDTNSPIYELLNDTNLYNKLKPFFETNTNIEESQEQIINNFNERYPQYPLANFKLSRNFLFSDGYETDVFNVSLMDRLLENDVKWIGDGTCKGYREMIKNVSLHMQYIHYQMSAAKSWGALITSYVKFCPTPLHDGFIDITIHFLENNIDCENTKGSLLQLYQERTELSFYILYSFQRSKKQIPNEKLVKLLGLLIRILKSNEIDYLGSLTNNNGYYTYRSILRSVLVILNLNTNRDQFIETASDQLLEFFEWAFCKGTYLIFSSIVYDLTSSLNKNQTNFNILSLDEKIQDLFLLLSLFKKIRELKPSIHFNNILASSLYDVGTIKVILNLYSNANLLKISDEPILGHLTLNFIVELCTVPSIAEKFIRNGLFVVLLESPLSMVLQNGEIRPEFYPRLHNIWSNGLLSILLLLLSHFGSKILPETCLFLSYFNKQIHNALSCWFDSKLTVSSALIRETSQLIMLQQMLDELNYIHYLKTATSRTEIGDEPIGLIPGLDDAYERRELATALNKLLTHPKYLNSRIIAVSIEEQHSLDDETSRSIFVQKVNQEIKDLQASLIPNA